MPKVIWLPEALADIERLTLFLRDKNPHSARSALLSIKAGAQHLASFPEIGRLLRDGSHRRELFVAFGAGAYVLRYRIDQAGSPVVIRVWHSRESRL
jgi:plasmid stabilization system protein ParE